MNQQPRTLGILKTGIVDETLVTAYGSYPAMFIQLFAAADPTMVFKCYNVIDDHYPADIDECDAYLITGSKSDSFADDPWIVTLKQYIHTLMMKRKKLIGICFGHQIIAHALGGLAGRSPNGWGVGVHNVQVPSHIKTPWLTDNTGQLNLLVSHQDQVLKLPAEATLLATSTFCPNAAYFIADQVLCFQGHPEFSPPYARALLEMRRANMDEAVCERAIASYEQAIDDQKVSRWILDFIGGGSRL